MDKIEEDTSSIWKQLTELQEYINVNKEDLQSIRMYQIKLDLKLFELLKLTLDESLKRGNDVGRRSSFKQQKSIIDLGPVLAIRIEHVRT